MIKDNKGQVMTYKLMVMVWVIMLALVLINPLREIIIDARDTDQLDCTNSSITFGQQATCLGLDVLLPYFIGSIIVFGFAYYFSKKRTDIE